MYDMVPYKVCQPFKLLTKGFSSAADREKFFARRLQLSYEEKLRAKKLKAEAKKQFNWINFSLHGPQIKHANQEPRVDLALSRHCQDSTNSTKCGKMTKDDSLKILPYNRPPRYRNPSILGNNIISPSVVKLNLNNIRIRTSVSDSSFQDILELFKLNAVPEFEFPFCNLKKHSQDFLRKASENVLGFINIGDEFYDYMPNISTVIDCNNSNLQITEINNLKLNFISKYGLATYYDYQEEILLTEAQLHKALMEYFKGIPLENIHRDKIIAQHWESLVNILSDISDVELMRTKLTHPYLLYSGFVDYVGKYKERSVLIEVCVPDLLFSQSFTNVQSIYQAVAKLGIYNAVHDDNKVQNILLIIVDGTAPAKVLFFTETYCKEIWKHWIGALHSYWSKRREYPMINTYFNIKLE